MFLASFYLTLYHQTIIFNLIPLLSPYFLLSFTHTITFDVCCFLFILKARALIIFGSKEKFGEGSFVIIINILLINM